MTKRRPRAQVDREIVARSRWAVGEHVGLICVFTSGADRKTLRHRTEAACRILNRLNAAGKGKRK